MIPKSKFYSIVIATAIFACSAASNSALGAEEAGITKGWTKLNFISYDSKKKKWIGSAKSDLFVGGLSAFSTTVRGDPRGGRGGDDVFIPGPQVIEKFFGGPGRDTYVFLPDASNGLYADTIKDFNPANGDRIDLSLFDAMSKRPGHQFFRYIGESPTFEGRLEKDAAGQLRFWDGVLYGEVNGSWHADPSVGVGPTDDIDLVVKLDGVKHLARSALILKVDKYKLVRKKLNLRKIFNKADRDF